MKRLGGPVSQCHIYAARTMRAYVLRILRASRMPVAMTSHLMMPPEGMRRDMEELDRSSVGV